MALPRNVGRGAAKRRLAPRGPSFEDVFREWPTEQRVGHALRSWKTLNEVSMWLTEAELTNAWAIEAANKRRRNILTRLSQRLAKWRRDQLIGRTI